MKIGPEVSSQSNHVVPEPTLPSARIPPNKRDGGSFAEKPSEPALPHTRELRVSLVAHRSISRRKKSPSKWNLRERSRFQECHPSVLPVDTIAGGDSQGNAYITNQSLSLNMGCALIQYTV